MVVGRIPYWLATFYTSLFRGTPLLLQIIFIYSVIPEVFGKLGIPQSYAPPPFWCGVAALALNYGAYLTEVFRAGIQAVPNRPDEAARALGITGRHAVAHHSAAGRKVVIPAVGNDFIALTRTSRSCR